MRVGIDFRVLQVGHQFRGIGAVARNVLRQIDSRLGRDVTFVAFVDPDTEEIRQEVASIFSPSRTVDVRTYPLPAHPRLAKLRDPVSANQEELLRRHADVLLQFDFMLGVPTTVASVVVLYDQIPLLLGNRYPHIYRPTYHGARLGGLSISESAYKGATRWIYERFLAYALERAHSVVAISDHTRSTTQAFADARAIAGVADKLVVARLGHSAAEKPADRPLDLMESDHVTGFGLDTTPFVFFMGGTDDRRRIGDLVAAFNRIRGRGAHLKLVLAGYDFVSIDRVLSPTTKAAIESSSYGADIHLLGFVSEGMRQWLYGHASAFVFPTLFEGFGMPILEAVSVGCPVVAYNNSAIPEVAGPNCILVDTEWIALANGIEEVLARTAEQVTELAQAGHEWASRFTWDEIGNAVTVSLEQATMSGQPSMTGRKRDGTKT